MPIYLRCFVVSVISILIGTHIFVARTFAAIDESQFNRAIQRVSKAVEASYRTRGLTLTWDLNWGSDGYVARNLEMDPAKPFDFVIQITGGVARQKRQTQDSFELILCHEVGHALGGAPKFKFSGDWAQYNRLSSEFQADYFASLKCIKTVWDNDDNAGLVGTGMVPPRIKKLCAEAYSTVNSISLCMRTAIAGKNFIDSAPVGAYSSSADLNSFSKRVVSQTWQMDDQDSLQCRLDTMIAGAVCAVDPSEPLSESELSIHACEQGPGMRPQCWYAPGTSVVTPPWIPKP